jgi:predicted DNA-binding transcriptional regulator AlpA
MPTDTASAAVEPSERLLRRSEVRARVGNPCAETLWRWIKAGEFPHPVKLNPSGSILAWRESEIVAWIENRQCGEGYRPVAAWEGRRKAQQAKNSTRRVGFVRRAP